MPRYPLIECRRGGCNDDPRSLEGREAGVAGQKIQEKKKRGSWGLALAEGMAMAQRASERE